MVTDLLHFYSMVTELLQFHFWLQKRYNSIFAYKSVTNLFLATDVLQFYFMIIDVLQFYFWFQRR